MKRYFWDFFGPRGAGTAEHFERHLRQFLSTHDLQGCETGLESSGEGHHAVFCSAPSACEAAIEQNLRPRRVLEVSDLGGANTGPRQSEP
jgi:hypothetical protein